MNVQRCIFFFAVCLLLCTGVCAADADGDADLSSPSDSVEGSSSVVVQDFSLDGLATAISEAIASLQQTGELLDVRAISVPLYDSDAGVAPAYDLDNGQTSEPSGTLKSILVKLIGPYNPVVVEYRYQNNNQSTYSYVREIQLDYVWCAAAALFALLIFCTFRLGGALLRKI